MRRGYKTPVGVPTAIPGEPAAPADPSGATAGQGVVRHRRADRDGPHRSRGSGHRPRPAPEQHRCSCGRLRDQCVRDVVRRLWS
jgi:hypothetical protein